MVDTSIKTKLKQLNNQWNLVDNKLIRSFKFKDFEVTFNFMKEIAILSERLRHHPSWTNTYNKLEITLKVQGLLLVSSSTTNHYNSNGRDLMNS